ncbi:myo-inosose-2 dehydratase [Salipaludibacillus sp. CF4.18]|uniref:myo-inosose-2 dehydratase n=1 Tax=Salipaludibacillus sp. CF4.18 TaxID=3373081 RepID=UPI003EE53D74
MTNVTSFKLGIAPIGWANDDLPDLGDRYTFENIVDDLSNLGYQSTELGRKFPTDPEVLKKELSSRSVQLSSKFVGTHFSVPEKVAESLQEIEDWLDFLIPLGVKYLIVCEMGGSMHWDHLNRGKDERVFRLDEESWKQLIDGLHQAGKRCKERGVKLVYHPHGGTVIESEAETNRLMALTDPTLVHLLYDSGHVYYGDGDPIRVYQNHRKRIQYIHLKDVRKSVLQEMKEQEMNFRTAVRNGVFTVPGDGDINFEPVLTEMLIEHYEGWVVVEAEQDPEINDPYEMAKKAKGYIDETVQKINDRLSR